MPSATQKKTSRFSLVYRLNEPDGTFDQWDFENVVETFDYTPEEVLIKLYGLKNRLQRDFLPLEAKIVDITGEGDYFSQKNLNIWKIQNPIGFFTEGHRVKFDVWPKGRDLFIEDSAMVLKANLDQNDDSSNYNAFLNLDIAEEPSLTAAQRTELKETYEAFYETYHDRQMDSWNANFNKTNIPVGCPVILDSTESWDDIWDEAQFVWEDAKDANDNLKVTWDNWWKRWVYEVEWIIDGPNDWHKVFRGPVDDYRRLPLRLPYNGTYTVELRFYDLFGHMSYYKKEDLFDVKLKDMELYGVYKWLESKGDEKPDWNSKFLDWNHSGGYWNFAQDNTSTIADSIATFYLTLDRANYLHREEDQGIRFSMVRRFRDNFSETGYSETEGPYQWDECRFRWKDTQHNWWDNLRVGSDLTASFKINWLEQGDTLRIVHKHPSTGELHIGEHVIQSESPNDAYDLTRWQAIIDELEASEDYVISKFNYNPVYLDINEDGVISQGYVYGSDEIDFILCVGQEYSKTYDFESVKIIKGPNSTIDAGITGEVHVQHSNPTWDNMKVFNDYAEVERSTHVTISTDISKFPGATKAKWTITNLSNPEITDIYYNNMWLTYIFQDPGNYSIQLETEDTNGNKNVVQRNMLKVK